MAKIRLPTDIIDRVSEIRAKNNKNWMDILRLAFEAEPSKARKIMRQIQLNDKEITKWLSKL